MIDNVFRKFNEGEEQFSEWHDALTEEEKQCLDARIESETEIVYALIRLVKSRTVLKIVGVQWA